jgi:hypothetical protein
MEEIREHLTYKNTPLTICMAKLTPQEQYEVIRILLESKTPVKICTHEATNKHINSILKQIQVLFVQCWEEEILLGGLE